MRFNSASVDALWISLSRVSLPRLFSLIKV